MVCFCCFAPFAYMPELVFSFLVKVFFEWWIFWLRWQNSWTFATFIDPKFPLFVFTQTFIYLLSLCFSSNIAPDPTCNIFNLHFEVFHNNKHFFVYLVSFFRQIRFLLTRVNPRRPQDCVLVRAAKGGVHDHGGRWSRRLFFFKKKCLFRNMWVEIV